MNWWAIDLGTTNSTIGRWNKETDTPDLINIEDICLLPVQDRKIEVRYSIPSCVYVLPQKGFKNWFGSFPIIQNNFFIGQQGLIGRKAIEKDSSSHSPHFVKEFKPYLLKDSYKTLAKIGDKNFSTQKITTIFLRELFALVKQKTGERPRNIAFCVPVDSYEPYRARIKHIAKSLGVRNFKVIDEPVAAAIGYGLRIDESQFILVFDFGGGTLDIALIELKEENKDLGTCKVIAKCGLPIGGNLIDAWLVEEYCKRHQFELSRYSDDTNILWWYRVMQEEACRIKESLFFKEKETFFLTPPKELKRFEARLREGPGMADTTLDFTRDDLIELLNNNGLYVQIEQSITNLLSIASEKGIAKDDIKEVLMVGGSTLLPKIYPTVEKIFGRGKLRAWQPFEAVAYGASAYAANRLTESDFIIHDYAIKTYNKETHEPEYNVIVPKGTTFPTKKHFWKRHFTPTCPLGVPEKIFKLVICEIGKRHKYEQEFVWDKTGHLHMLKEGEDNKPIIIPLNEENPALGYLNPAHSPSDKSARLEISFMVNEERWLCTTVYDILAGKNLLSDSPVYRLK